MICGYGLGAAPRCSPLRVWGWRSTSPTTRRWPPSPAVSGWTARSRRWPPTASSLRSRPGWGVCAGVSMLTSFGLAVEIGDWTWLSGRSIGAYLGLVPTESSSGGSRSQGSITKTGNGHRVLIEAAWHPAGPTAVPGSTCSAVGRRPHRRPGTGASARTGACTSDGQPSTPGTSGPWSRTPRSPGSWCQCGAPPAARRVVPGALSAPSASPSSRPRAPAVRAAPAVRRRSRSDPLDRRQLTAARAQACDVAPSRQERPRTERPGRDDVKAGRREGHSGKEVPLARPSLRSAVVLRPKPRHR